MVNIKVPWHGIDGDAGEVLMTRDQISLYLSICHKLNGGSEFVRNQNPAMEFPPTLLL